MMKLFQKNGNFSWTKVLMTIAFFIALIKYALAGLTIGEIVFPAFDAAAATAICGLSGTLYIASNSKLTNTS